MLVRLLWRPRYYFARNISSMEEKAPLRTCNKCHKTLPLSEFGIHVGAPEGRNRICKRCRQKNSHAYRIHVAQHETVLYRCREMLRGARNRARRKNIEFSLVLEDILTLAEQPRCPITHRLLNWKNTVDKDSRGSHSPDTPALDRIDSQRGYTPDNVWIISHRMNTIKNNATPRELALISRAVNDEMMRRVCNDF